MAWISGLADKAENILNKLDQNAATALQVTATAAGETNALDVMRRSLSNSTLSLKTALSPVKVRIASSIENSSMKKDSSSMVPGDLVVPKEKLAWNIGTDTKSSRRSSVHSNADSVTIEVEKGSVLNKDVNIYDTPKIEETGNFYPNAVISSLTSMDSTELAAFKIALNEVISERDELRARLSDLAREVENDNSKHRIQDMEMLLQRLTEERDQAQCELSVIQSTNSAYVHSLSELETNLAKLQQEYMDLAQKLQMQIKENEHQRKELQDYRIKAQLALQMKDNLIAELKSSGSGAIDSTLLGSESERMLQIELETIQQEHQQKIEECESLRMHLEVSHRNWDTINEQHASQLAAQRSNEEALRMELRSERESLLAVESEQRVQAKELAKLRQQLSNQMAASATRLQEKEQQLQQLRSECMRRNMANIVDGRNSGDDNNERIKTLTQTLIEKQQTVERITAERNALRIQLENMQDKLQHSLGYSDNGVNSSSGLPRNALLSNSTDDVKAQFPMLMRENPFDNRVARRVKRVYSSLDSAVVSMAWISGLADKAENILNKLDQNAATALQVTATAAGETNALDVMRRSLSNSTLSLKTALSPVKVRIASSIENSSMKKDSSSMVPGDLVVPKEKLAWNIGTDTKSSRRSSVHSNADSVTIEVEKGSVLNKDVNIYDTPKIEETGNFYPNAVISSLTSMDSTELAAFKIALNEVISERDELRARLSDLAREVENDNSKHRIQDMEMLLQRLTEERDQAQCELSVIQSTNSAYVHSLSELETNLAKLQQEYMDLAQKLQMQIKENEHQRKELQDYRIKAQLALQMKDNLIAELKSSGSGAIDSTLLGSESERMLQIELETIQQEHQQKIEECESLRMHLEVSHRNWDTINEQHASQLAAQRSNEEALRMELRSERESLLAVESEQRVQAKELAKLRQQLSNQMAASATRLQEKEQQLQQLRSECMRRNMANIVDGRNSGDDNNERIKTLTQTLIEKQQTVERITAERNALRIQLENMQDKLQHSLGYSDNGVNSSSGLPRNALLSNSTDDVKAQFPMLMRENPFDNRVARRVKRVYSSLDSAGIRLGAFLRRYPLMRIFVLMYVGLLHIWVMFVLLSSTPN